MLLVSSILAKEGGFGGGNGDKNPDVQCEKGDGSWLKQGLGVEEVSGCGLERSEFDLWTGRSI